MIHAILEDREHGFSFNTQDQHLVQHALLLMGYGNDDFWLSLERVAGPIYTDVVLNATGSLLRSVELIVPVEAKEQPLLPLPFEFVFSSGEGGEEWVTIGNFSTGAYEVSEVLEGLSETSMGMVHITINDQLLAETLEKLQVAWKSVRGSYASGTQFEEFNRAFEEGWQAFNGK
jgi:hypothetical protein